MQKLIYLILLILILPVAMAQGYPQDNALIRAVQAYKASDIDLLQQLAYKNPNNKVINYYFAKLELTKEEPSFAILVFKSRHYSPSLIVRHI